MGYTLNITNYIATFEFEVSDEAFTQECKQELIRSKERLNLSVYRDGKVPREVLQQVYDQDEMLKRVINTIIGREYEQAIAETNYIPLTAPLAKVIQCKKDEPFLFSVQIVVKPEFELGDYKDLRVKHVEVNVTEDEIETVLQKFQLHHANRIEVLDRPVQMNDHLVLDFEGFLHGRAFPGNKADNFPLIVGSNSFIPGFEENILGATINEAKDFTITYPSDYRVESLAGQEVIFRCIVRKITEVQKPQLTDELVQAHTSFESIDAYRENIRKTMLLQKRALAFKDNETMILNQLVEHTKVDAPAILYDIEVKRLEEEQKVQLSNRGLTLEHHIKTLGLTPDTYKEQLRNLAIKRVKTRLILLAIAEKEQLVATEEDLKQEIKQMSKAMNKSEDSFQHPFSIHQIANEISIKKALQFVLEQSKES